MRGLALALGCGTLALAQTAAGAPEQQAKPVALVNPGFESAKPEPEHVLTYE